MSLRDRTLWNLWDFDGGEGISRDDEVDVVSEHLAEVLELSITLAPRLCPRMTRRRRRAFRLRERHRRERLAVLLDKAGGRGMPPCFLTVYQNNVSMISTELWSGRWRLAVPIFFHHGDRVRFRLVFGLPFRERLPLRLVARFLGVTRGGKGVRA